MEVREPAPSRGQLEVAAVQIKFESGESLADRISRLEGLISGINGADLIVLPELWLHGGFSYDTWRRDAISLEGPVLDRLSDLARHKKVWLHAGSFMEKELSGGSSEMWNTSILFDSSGAMQASYRKIHRFGFSDGEPRLISAGDRTTVAEVQTEKAAVLAGLSTCYDLRFPELYRHMSSEGAALNLIPACWPLSRVEHWKTLGRARAIENQCYVVQCNMTGADGKTELGGHSQIVNANGDILAQAGVEETIIRARLDMDTLSETRRSFPVLKDQRTDIWTFRGQNLKPSTLQR